MAKQNVGHLFKGRKPKSLWGGATKAERKQYAQQVGYTRRKRWPNIVKVYKQLMHLQYSGNAEFESEQRMIRYCVETFCNKKTNNLFKRFMGEQSLATYPATEGRIEDNVRKYFGKKPGQKAKRARELLREIELVSDDLSRVRSELNIYTRNVPKIKAEVARNMQLRFRDVNMEANIGFSVLDFVGNSLQEARFILAIIREEAKKTIP